MVNLDRALGPPLLVRYIDVFEALSLEDRKVPNARGRPTRQTAKSFRTPSSGRPGSGRDERAISAGVSAFSRPVQRKAPLVLDD
jgi:hypothetical protein